MIRTLTGTTISYGSILPPAVSAPDGALFFKTSADTDGVSNLPGLYIFNFQQDFNMGIPGDQVGVGWQPASKLVDYVELAGTSRMSGNLNVGGASGMGGVQVAISATSAPGLVNFKDGSGTIIGSQMLLSGAWNFSTTPTVGGATIWDSANDGPGSGLDADLLDGQHGSFYLNLANSNGSLDINTRTSGTLSISKGGTNSTSTIQGGIVFGASINQYGTTLAGTAGQVLLSNGSSVPSWANQSTLSVGYAVNAGNANTAGSVTSAAQPAITSVGTLSRLMVADGTGQAPSITFASDFGTDTGFNHTTDGEIQVILNSTNAIQFGVGGSIYANGNITGLNMYATGTLYVAGTTTSIGSINTNGSISAVNDIIAYASDARLKKNVKVISRALEKVGTLGGYEYDWDLEKTGPLGFTPTNEHEHGLLAQEVQVVMPDAVAKAPFNPEYLTVKYDRLVALLVAAVNEQQVQIAELQAMVGDLSTR